MGEQVADGLLDLAARCEAASGADRELDVRVSLALSGTPYAESDVADILNYRDEPTGYGKYRPADEYVPTYTSSLDAAMKLVPEKLTWHAGRHVHAGWCNAYIVVPQHRDQHIYVKAKTPALALTAAALRARATGVPEDAR